MKLTNQQIFDSVQSLNKLLKQKIPARLAYKVAKLAQDLDPINKQINDKRTKIATELGGKKDPKMTARAIVVPTEQARAAQAAIHLMMQTEHEVDFRPIEISEFGGALIEPEIILKGGWIFGTFVS